MTDIETRNENLCDDLRNACPGFDFYLLNTDGKYVIDLFAESGLSVSIIRYGLLSGTLDIPKHEELHVSTADEILQGIADFGLIDRLVRWNDFPGDGDRQADAMEAYMSAAYSDCGMEKP